ncbi:monocarboxylate transporter 2-like isoform 2-T2 [Spinachia spinachia]
MPPALANGLGYKPLDGGWGWMVVVGAHISIGFAYSTPKVLSIFFKEIQENLEASSSEISWISSIMLAVMYAGGPVSSLLVNRFGSRPIVMLGGLLCGVSMVAASFGNSIVYLYLCIGIIGGCGLSLNLNASLTIISKYFLIKRPLANGLAMAGSPVFLCILAPVNQYLLHMFGWRGSLLILGALMLNCCVAGALMRPVVQPRKHCAPQSEVEEQPKNCNTKPKIGCIDNTKTFLDFTFFKDRGFIIYLIGNILFIFGAYAPIVFLSAYAIDQGVEEYSAAYLLSIMGFVDMFVRPATGLMASSKWIRPRIQYFFSFAMVFNGTCHLLCPLATSYAFLVTAVGLVTIIECFPMLLGPPAAGLLVDIFNDYKYLFFMCGSVIVTGGLFLFVMNIYNYYVLEKEKPAKVREQKQITIENQDQTNIAS